MLVTVLTSTSTAHAMVSPNNEWRGPTGAFAGHAPLGWMLVIHGGGWLVVGKPTVIEERPWAAFFAAHGWGTYTIDYRPGPQSLVDVDAAYDLLRSRVGRRTPLCAIGTSAGGQLAMMLAADRQSLRCVISEAGPTDLLSLESEPAAGATALAAADGPTVVFTQYVVRAFGSAPRTLARFSPLFAASRIKARMLLGTSAADPLVPPFQMDEMCLVRPLLTRTMLLAAGTGSPPNFTHASVTLPALRRWHAAELQLLAETRKSVSARVPAKAAAKKSAGWSCSARTR